MTSYTEDFFDFIKANKTSDPNALRLKFYGKQANGIDYAQAIDQIEARRKSGTKLSALTAYEHFLFPATICAEQATSSAVAAFHASLIPEGCSVLDLTCGLGSDAFAMAKKAGTLTAIERNPHYQSVFKINCETLRASNIDSICADSEKWLKENDDNFDVIFVDPHRRGKGNIRTYAFEDCIPDVSRLAPELLERCERLIMKASPMLDISAVAKEIAGCEEIYVVSENGECKEALVLARKDGVFSNVHAVSINKEKLEIFTVNCNETGINDEQSFMDNPGRLSSGFLYEPNASLMKIRPWKALCRKFNDLSMLHPNTNIFHSNTFYPDFPGRRLNIKGILDIKVLKSLKDRNFNVCVRNYPLNASKLEAKLKTRPSDTDYIYGVGVGQHKASPVLIECALIADN